MHSGSHLRACYIGYDVQGDSRCIHSFSMYINSAIAFTLRPVPCATSDRLSLTPWLQHYVHLSYNLVWTMSTRLSAEHRQNSWSRTVPTTVVISALRWLPVRQRIVFKVAVLTHKTLHTQQPAYLHCLLHPYQPSRTYSAFR